MRRRKCVHSRRSGSLQDGKCVPIGVQTAKVQLHRLQLRGRGRSRVELAPRRIQQLALAQGPAAQQLAGAASPQMLDTHQRFNPAFCSPSRKRERSDGFAKTVFFSTWSSGQIGLQTECMRERLPCFVDPPEQSQRHRHQAPCARMIGMQRRGRAADRDRLLVAFRAQTAPCTAPSAHRSRGTDRAG